MPDCASEQTMVTAAADLSLFPIFRKGFQEPQPIRDLYTHIADTTTNGMLALHKWKPIGNEQYQIDAGQKEFGMKQCAQCGMTYSVHEPEDELLHLKYHNSVEVLAFKVIVFEIVQLKEEIFNRFRIVTGMDGRTIGVRNTRMGYQWSHHLRMRNGQ